MGKLENNKQQKRTSLLDTAFKLFTTQGVSKTSIAEISQKAGIAKGTFYLYFKDKYDIRNKLVSHEASKLFKNAVSALELHIKEQQINDHSFTITFTEEIIFIADHIINVLNTNQTLLTFISKNLSGEYLKRLLQPMSLMTTLILKISTMKCLKTLVLTSTSPRLCCL